MADPATWTAAAIIGIALGIAGQVESGFFMFNAINGWDSKDAPMPNMGEPWTAWIQTGLDGTTNKTIPDDDPLQRAAGPFPNMYLFNDVGHYLGKPYTKNDYGRSNTVTDVSIFPNKKSTDEGQDATWAILSARDGGRDGMLVTELAWGFLEDKQFRSGPYGINAHTFRSCGAPWYPSGIHRPLKDGGSTSLPGFWLGGEHGLGAIQVYGPFHTYGKSNLDFDKYAPGKNACQEDLIREFCHHPARLSFHKDPIPERSIKDSLITDFDLTEDRTRSVTEEWKDHLRYSGRPGSLDGDGDDNNNGGGSNNIFARSPGSKHEPSRIPSNRKLLTIVDDEIGLSAMEVCQSSTAFGPDYVNIHEGMFCRMKDRKLVPLCQQLNDSNGSSKTASQDGGCFDMETKRIEYGWPSDAPVASERVRRNQARHFAHKNTATQTVYDGELRSGGDGWEYSAYT